ncbi:MAG: right-handed parallel beta-helix repeat-containing protein [Desulfobacteraceae bacterium]|nr:MAG: right-handed parallel beta-helix repeat-containing protein [Desulfobacteraceae bacterium]
MHASRLSTVFLGSVLILMLILKSANADFYVVAGGGKKIGTEIKELPYTITDSGGFYFITKNMNAPAGSDAITVAAGASDVTIDLMGFAVRGPSGSSDQENGIYLNTPLYNVEIRNGTLTDFDANGIYAPVSGINGLRIINVRACYNDHSGFNLSSAKAVFIKNSTALGNDVRGITVGAGSIVVENTSLKNGHDGIYTGSGSTVKGNMSYDNGQTGIYTEGGCTVQGNTCSENMSGIRAGLGSIVAGNTCYSNASFGIYLDGGSYVGENTSYANGTNMSACPACTVSADNHAP